MKNKHNLYISYAILGAVLFGVGVPFSKLLVNRADPLFIAALLYLGAGLGMWLIFLLRGSKSSEKGEARLTRKETPFILLMIVLDIAAPIFLMLGISLTNSGTASLLGNFEIAATALAAMLIFKEPVGKRLWLAIAFITAACIILSVEDPGQFNISVGALLVLLSCVCWGIENNCTRNLSIKDPMQIVIIKGFGSGSGALVIAFVWGSFKLDPLTAVLALLLGFISYGLSIFFYVRAQRELGAARTGAYYAAAPFVGAAVSWILPGGSISVKFLIALAVMAAGAFLAMSESHKHEHIHSEETHEHMHRHDDEHHSHPHAEEPGTEHNHIHTHSYMVHDHVHLPEIHHRHNH